MKIIQATFNTITGEETIVEREETKEEKASREKDSAERLAFQNKMAEEAIAKAALLVKLGITEEEAKLLLS